MINYHLKYGHSYLFHKNSPQEPMSSNSNSTSVEDPLMWLPPYLCKCYNLFIYFSIFFLPGNFMLPHSQQHAVHCGMLFK